MKIFNSTGEMIEAGEKLFGKDRLQWRFKCPACGNVQTPQQFIDIKADVNQATFNCIGRYSKGPVYKPFGDNEKDAPKQPCNYTSGGFLLINTVFYKADGKQIPTFEFAK